MIKKKKLLYIGNNVVVVLFKVALIKMEYCYCDTTIISIVILNGLRGDVNINLKCNVILQFVSFRYFHTDDIISVITLSMNDDDGNDVIN